MSRRLLPIVLVAALFVPAAPAAAVPTTATSLTGDLDAGTFRTAVAMQRLPSRLRLVVFRVDSTPSDEIYDLVVLRGLSCSSDNWRRRVLTRLQVGNETLVDVRRTLPRRALRRRVSLAIVERGATSGGFDACRQTRPWGRNGTIISPRDTASGLPGGVVAIWVPQGSPAVGITALIATGGGDFLLGASRRPCGDGFTATDDLWQWRKDLVDGFADFRQPRWPARQTESIAVVDRAQTQPGPAKACEAFSGALGPA